MRALDCVTNEIGVHSMNNRDNLKYHQCDKNESWWEYDARGLPLARVCDTCRAAKLAMYRPDVLTDPGYWHDEPIDEDE